jgi:hypothetical protein
MDCNGGIPGIPTKYFNPSDAKIWFGMLRAPVHYRNMPLIDIRRRAVSARQQYGVREAGGMREEA